MDIILFTHFNIYIFTDKENQELLQKYLLDTKYILYIL